jgi:hypothetical protein
MFIFVHHLDRYEFVMQLEETVLNLLNRLFEEGVCLYGGDWKEVVNHVKGQIDVLGPGERAAIGGAFERLLAFRAPDFQGGLLH